MFICRSSDVGCYTLCGQVAENPPKPGTKASDDREAKLKQQYKPLDEATALVPCIVIDMQGVILAWYLPGILSDSRRVGLLLVQS